MIRVLALLMLCALPLGAQTYEMTPEEAAIHAEGEAAFGRQDPAAAEAAYREVIARLAEKLPANHPFLLNVEGDLAATLSLQGDRAGALALRRDILARFRETSTVYHPMHAIAQMNLAKALAEVGAHREALPLAIEAVTVAEGLHGTDGYVANVWRGELAGMMFELGFWADAEALYARSMAALDAEVVRLGEAQTAGLRLSLVAFAERYATALARQGRFAEAVVAQEDTIARRLAFFGEGDVAAMPMRLVLAGYRLNAGQVEEMHSGLKALIPQIEAAQGEGPELASALSLDALWWLGQEFRSEPFMQGVEMLRRSDAMFAKAFETRGQGFQHEFWGRAALNLAAVLLDLEDWRGAVEAALRAEELGLGSRNVLMKALYGAAEAEQMSWGEVIPQAFRVAQHAGGGAASHALEQMAARVSLGDSPAAALHRQITDAVDREAALQAEYAALLQVPGAERDAAREIALKAELSEVSRRQKALTDELYETAPDFTALINDGWVEHSEVKALLGPDEAVVLMDIGSEDGDFDFVFVVTSEFTYWWAMPVSPSQLAMAVSDIRAAVDLKLGVRGALALKGGGADREAFPYHAASWLYEQTFGQFEELLEGKTHIFVELRGPLTAVPPQLLIKGEARSLEEAHWLIRDHAVTVIPSVFALKAMEIAASKPRAPEPILGVADPIFDPTGEAPVQVSSNRGGALAPLPETWDEVKAVAASMGADAVLRQGEASEAAVKGADLERFRVLYFATHGLVSGDEVKDLVVEEPALALTPGGGEDGLLTASEIALLRINPDWVVLSACNTAVGETPDAEALSGLAQAFLYAGARALLVSHWPVESQSAVSLMTDIFARRAADEQLGAAEAQRQAILAMIDGPKAEWRHPAYWAPFILVGDPDR